MIDNFDQLVQRCTAKRRRRMIRLSLMVSGSIVLSIAALSGYLLWLNPHQAVPQQTAAATEENNLSSHTEENLSIVPVLNPAVPSEINATALPHPQTVLPPVQTITQTKAVINTTPLPAVAVPVAAAPLPQQTPKPVVPASAVIQPATAPAPTAAVTPKNGRIFEVNTPSNISPAETYQKDPTYETALAAARSFYAQQNYTDAATWAKKANQLNREGEEAWLLYAKSYYAQGRKKEAIELLELFLNYKDSKAASELLRTWKLTPSN